MGTKFGFDEKTLVPKGTASEVKRRIVEEVRQMDLADHLIDTKNGLRDEFQALLRDEKDMAASYITGDYRAVLDKFDHVHDGFTTLMHKASYDSMIPVLREIYNIRQMYAVSRVMVNEA